MTKEEVIERIKENKDVSSIKTISGYTVRTIFSKLTKDQEVYVNVIVVYKEPECKNVLQVSVDGENRFGTLLATSPFSIRCIAEEFVNQDFNEIADQVISYLH